MRNLLERFVLGLNPQHYRRTEGHRYDGKKEFILTRGERPAEVLGVHWSFLVSDVRLDTAEHYCLDVRRWAEAVLADTATLVEQRIRR